MKRDNSMTVARVCGNKWGIGLAPSLAAAYLGLTNAGELEEFGYSDLAFEFCGRIEYDRDELTDIFKRAKEEYRHKIGEKTRPGNGSNRDGCGNEPQMITNAR